MSKIRQKLERLNAPRPTTMPDGAEVVSIPAPNERKRHEVPGRSSPERPDATAARRRTARPQASPAGDDEPSLPPRLDRSAREPKGATRPTAPVVRRDQFEAWRTRRRARLTTLGHGPTPDPGRFGLGSPAASEAPAPPVAETVSAKEPETPHEYFERALTRLARRSWAEAEADLRAAVDHLDGRERWAALKHLATLSLERGDMALAERWLREMIDGPAISDPFAFVELAAIVEAAGDSAEARELTARARRIAPWLGS